MDNQENRSQFYANLSKFWEEGSNKPKFYNKNAKIDGKTYDVAIWVKDGQYGESLSISMTPVVDTSVGIHVNTPEDLQRQRDEAAAAKKANAPKPKQTAAEVLDDSLDFL